MTTGKYDSASDSQYSEEVNVRIDNLTKYFTDDDGSDVTAVKNASIDVHQGEFLVLVGPSGCGKTTTLRTIAGLETPSEGQISIEGENIVDSDPRERGVSMVFQNYALYPHMTIRENISFPLRVRNFREEEINKKVGDTAELLEINELLDRKPDQLSGGQQQRVALGRAIVREPSVFLMDEPLSNLDAKLRVQMRTELKALHQRVDKTTIYVTHDQEEAMTLGDRIVIMKGGEIQQIGDPQRVYDRPLSRFVAGFIGEPPMNFIPVNLEQADGTYRVTCNLFKFELPNTVCKIINDYEGSIDRVTLGIRPENIYDPDLNDISNDNTATFTAQVQLIEPLGSDKYLTITGKGGSKQNLTVQSMTGNETSEDTITARVSPKSDAKVLETTELEINLNKIHLFDDATGKNILFQNEDKITSPT